MDWTSGRLDARFRTGWTSLIAATLVTVALPSLAEGQVRGKAPDRGVYTPPRLDDGGGTTQDIEPAVSQAQAVSRAPSRPTGRYADHGPSEVKIAEMLRSSEAPVEKKPASRRRTRTSDVSNANRPLVGVALEIHDAETSEPIPSGSVGETRTMTARPAAALQRVSHDEVKLVPPSPPADIPLSRPSPPVRQGHGLQPIPASPQSNAGLTRFDGGQPVQLTAAPIYGHDSTCDGCDACDSYCDTYGCDSMGGCDSGSWAKGSLCFNRDRWFGSVEYLMMWNRGDRLPPLVTTDISDNPDPVTAGRLDSEDTRSLVGADKYMDRLASGARITLGTWLDEKECFAFVGRAWYGGRKDYRYSQNQDQTSILVRPFFDVEQGEQSNLLVAFDVEGNEIADGAVFVDADLESFGADLAIRQFLCCDLGVTLDFVYGYQFMRMTERLGIASTSTTLENESTLRIADSFSVSNDFHGGQIGLASSYRECCWSFNGLAKVGFGSLRRSATRRGVTVTEVPPDDVNIEPQGLLVRSTNDGKTTDNTFGWVPELDLTLGWHRFKGWDLTFGYHLIVLTDALQVSGAIDPGLAVNLSDPLTGDARPTRSLQYRTYYLQGLHFGLQHNY